MDCKFLPRVHVSHMRTAAFFAQQQHQQQVEQLPIIGQQQ